MQRSDSPVEPHLVSLAVQIFDSEVGVTDGGRNIIPLHVASYDTRRENQASSPQGQPPPCRWLPPLHRVWPRLRCVPGSRSAVGQTRRGVTPQPFHHLGVHVGKRTADGPNPRASKPKSTKPTARQGTVPRPKSSHLCTPLIPKFLLPVLLAQGGSWVRNRPTHSRRCSPRLVSTSD